MLLRLNTLLDDLFGKISLVAALTVYRRARALGLMQIEIFNLPHCYLFWPRISSFNCLVFFVWDSQLLVWSDLHQVELQLISLYPPLRVQGPWRRTQLLHLFFGDYGDNVGDDDSDLSAKSPHIQIMSIQHRTPFLTHVKFKSCCWIKPKEK